MTNSKLDNPVLMGIVGAAHGIKGQCRVKSFTDDPLAIGEYGTLYDKSGRAFDVKDIRAAKNVVVIKFQQVKDRDSAESLSGTELFIDRSQLPDHELGEDEFYIEDLVGLNVIDEAGAAIGIVKAIHNFGADDTIEIAVHAENGKTAVYPFTRQVVPDIDLDNGSITLVPPTEIIVPPEGSRDRDASHEADE